MNAGRIVVLALGPILVVCGTVWTLQGIGWLGGSPMSGDTMWAVIGPIVAAIGILLLVRSRRR